MIAVALELYLIAGLLASTVFHATRKLGGDFVLTDEALPFWPWLLLWPVMPAVLNLNCRQLHGCGFPRERTQSRQEVKHDPFGLSHVPVLGSDLFFSVA